MGNLMIIFKVYPEEPGQETGIEAKIRKISLEQTKLQDLKIEPIAFGLKIIRVAFIVPDKIGGLQEKIEEELKGIENVREVEVEAATLL
jgi:translation elongation factor aEF-1 beta